VAENLGVQFMEAKDEGSLVLKGDRNLNVGEGQRMLKDFESSEKFFK
jgi:hypothetical protein